MIEHGRELNLRPLGRGSFGAVYYLEHLPLVAVKFALDDEASAVLRREFDFLCDINKIAGPSPVTFVKAISFMDDIKELARVAGLPGQVAPESRSGPLYAMQRVPPLCPALSNAIASRYMPGGECRQQFIGRVYLGRAQRRENARFCAVQNFPLSLDVLDAIGIDAAELAVAIGQALAMLHFEADVDARDVEFVLGGRLENPFFGRELFCIDFNQVGRRSTSDALFDAMKANDPYFPRDGELLGAFREAYVRRAAQAGKEADADRVMSLWTAHWRRE